MWGVIDTQCSGLHSTAMTYDSEIGSLLLRLVLFYHADECGLMVETLVQPPEWLANHQVTEPTVLLTPGSHFGFYQDP